MTFLVALVLAAPAAVPAPPDWVAKGGGCLGKPAACVGVGTRDSFAGALVAALIDLAQQMDPTHVAAGRTVSAGVTTTVTDHVFGDVTVHRKVVENGTDPKSPFVGEDHLLLRQGAKTYEASFHDESTPAVGSGDGKESRTMNVVGAGRDEEAVVAALAKARITLDVWLDPVDHLLYIRATQSPVPK